MYLLVVCLTKENFFFLLRNKKLIADGHKFHLIKFPNNYSSPGGEGNAANPKLLARKFWERKIKKKNGNFRRTRENLKKKKF